MANILSNHQARASRIVYQNHAQPLLIIEVGRSQAQADKMNADEAAHPDSPYQVCVTTLVVAQSVAIAMQSLPVHCPDLYQWGKDEVTSCGSVAVPDLDHAIYQALTDSWGQYSLEVIGNDGTSGQGALSWHYLSSNLEVAHIDLVLEYLYEYLEVNV